MTAVDAWYGLDQAALDRQYSPSSRVRSLRRYLNEYRDLSNAARHLGGVRSDLRYGPHQDQTLDFWPAPTPDAPVQVFVHGGNWQQLTKDSSAFAAPAFRRAGAAFAAVNYALAPRADLDQIVEMIRDCVRWLWTHADQLGFAADRIHLSGTSAGAHLVAMAMLPPELPIAGVTLLSGMYDLRPVRRTYINEALRLDLAAAERNSPLYRLPDVLPPAVFARGDNETDEYARQHELMAAALRARTSTVEFVVPDRNHFDLPYDIGEPGTALGAAVLAQLGLKGGADELHGHDSG
jgi:arylformamidase